MTKQELIDTIKALENEEVAVATNDGTFGAEECFAAVGNGDPKFGLYVVYERVGDQRRRVEGCNPDKAPGRTRSHAHASQLSDKRRELKSLREQLAKM